MKTLDTLDMALERSDGCHKQINTYRVSLGKKCKMQAFLCLANVFDSVSRVCKGKGKKQILTVWCGLNPCLSTHQSPEAQWLHQLPVCGVVSIFLLRTVT